MIAYNKLTESIKNNIINMYNELGFGSAPIITETLNISTRSFWRVLNEANINTRRRNNYTLNESFFENIDNEIKAYILGIMYADGFNGGINHICLGLKEKDHLQLIANALEFTGKIRDGKKCGGYSSENEFYYLNFSSKKMANDLSNLGVVTNKAKDVIELPNIPNNLMRHFIRGYFDGDGCAYEHKSQSNYVDIRVEIIGNKGFLDNIGIHLSDYNITYSFKKSKTDYMYYLRISGGRNIRSFYSYLYNDSNIYLNRKYNKLALIKPR